MRTVDNSAKVRRIRNNGQVNVAPCKVDGSLLGEWIPAMAREIKDVAIEREVDRLLDQKYGLMKKLIALASTLQGRNYSIIECKVRE